MKISLGEMNYHYESEARWSGRNLAKDELRQLVWNNLITNKVNVGPVKSRIQTL